MRLKKSVQIAAKAALLLCCSLAGAQAKQEPKYIHNAVRAFTDSTAVKSVRIPPGLFKSARGVAIIPGARKNDFMAVGKSAAGLLTVRDAEGKWSDPVFITLSGGTLGWQMVGEPMDIILIFKDQKRIDEILKKPLLMDVRVSVVPGPVGHTLKAASREELKAEINSYVRTHGEFANVSVGMCTIQLDAGSNDFFYGRQRISTEEILSGKGGKNSEDVKMLQKLLAEYAAGH